MVTRRATSDRGPGPGGGGPVQLTVHIQPRASRTEVTGLYGDAVKIRLTSPPVGGAANEELLRFLAARLSVPRADLTIVGGASGRRKHVRVAGASADEASLVRRLLEGTV